jgi:hypothetical protein
MLLPGRRDLETRVNRLTVRLDALESDMDHRMEGAMQHVGIVMSGFLACAGLLGGGTLVMMGMFLSGRLHA